MSTREVLDAKKAGAHLLLVDALWDGEPRRFPNLSNVPTVRWRFRDPALDARRVIDRAVLKALRFKHNRAQLQRVAQPGEVVLAAAPEALTLAYEYADQATKRTFLYPDPPLGREELEVLQRLRPNGRFVTPLTKIAVWKRPQNIDLVAVSISNSNDLQRYGLSAAHQQTLTDEIHLYLLLAGLRIGYGGALKGAFEDASNFTLRLFELVRGYAKIREDATGRPAHPIVNYPPWPLRPDYGDAEWALFGEEAQCTKGPRADLTWSDEEIFAPGDEGWRLAPNSPQRRYTWARGLSAMRNQITEHSQARLVIGGDLRRFQGIIAGVVEEAWFSLEARKPLYLVGAFGGAARAVGDLLMAIPRDEFNEADARKHVPDYDAAVACYGQYGRTFHGMQQIGNDIRKWSKNGLTSALNNGLNEAENEELMRATEPARIAALVLTGLTRLPAGIG